MVSDGDESCSETSSWNDDTSSERFCATVSTYLCIQKGLRQDV